MHETKSPGRLKRGDTSLDRPGLVFWGMLRGKERWVTPERLIEMKVTKNAWARRFGKTEEGREKARVRARIYSQTPQRKKFSREYQKKKRSIYSPRQRVRRREYKKMRLATDPHYRFADTLSKRMRNAFKHVGGKKNSPTQTLLGCTHEFFRGWIESQFVGPMSWENYGKLWSVDHIRPLASFDLMNPSEQLKAFHYSNCTPLFISENCAKSDRIKHEGRIVRAGHLRKANIIPFAANG